jgi:transglutaminase-like putative cysteine protease
MSHPVDAGVTLDAPNQKVVGRGDDWVELMLSRDTVTEETMDAEALAPFLAPDRFIQSDRPEIRAVADSIASASGATGAGLAAEMAHWVNGYITGKNFTQGFASALEVYQTRAGDCTEHSVLLTALLRAAGIPARPAVGLVYFQGQFIGHMWAEAYIDHWRTFDALDPETAPVRIRISTSEGGEAVDQHALLEAYSVVGGMRARVVGYHEQTP